ncbi:hypothetical protein BRD00_14315 [Halobacteriales archaeon QS_8_69_26]|nr:MAG: hypothetical protein BRD00_14315 [Halobacteriales archaeon QS_8_69_26]
MPTDQDPDREAGPVTDPDGDWDYEALGARSRERVDDVADRLLDRYDDVNYVEFAVENDRDRFESGYELVAEGFVGGAAAWPYDGDGRIAVVTRTSGCGPHSQCSTNSTRTPAVSRGWRKATV